MSATAMVPPLRGPPIAAAAVAVVAVLTVVAAAAAATVPVVARMRPIDISGTYTTTYAGVDIACPSTFTIGQGEPFSRAENLSSIAPHPNIALNFLGAALSAAGVPCTDGALVAIGSIQVFNPTVMSATGKPNGTALVWKTPFSIRMLYWADVFGLGVETLACGAAAPRWDPNTWVAFGEAAWHVVESSSGVSNLTRIDLGGRNRTAVFLNSEHVLCAMTAAPRRGLVQRPPAAPRSAADAGGAVSAGAAAGIGAAAAAVGLALGAAGGVSAARWRRRRRDRRLGGHAKAPAAVSGAGAGAPPWRPPPPPPLAAPQGGGTPLHPVVGLVLPSYGDPTGVPSAAAATAVAKGLREAFGLADAPPMPPELADSMAPPPMPDALRDSTISDPSTGARSGRL